MLLHFFHEKASAEFNGLPAGIRTQAKSKFKVYFIETINASIG